MPPEPSTAALALALLASPGVGERSLARWLVWAATRDEPPSHWVGRSRAELVRCFPDKLESVVVAIAGLDPAALARAEHHVGRVHRAGGQILLITQQDYPGALRLAPGGLGPPVLSVMGDLGLLEQDAGAVVGTRTPSFSGTELARRCAEWLVARNRIVVSGGAQGVDTVAHMTALESGGATLFVLPQGLLSFDAPEPLAGALEDGSAMLLSQFVPVAPWSVAAAVSRNETIAALSRLVCVIEPHSPGGSLKTGRDAIAQRKPVLVHGDAGSRSEDLIREGALPILDGCARFSDERLDEIWDAALHKRQGQIELL